MGFPKNDGGYEIALNFKGKPVKAAPFFYVYFNEIIYEETCDNTNDSGGMPHCGFKSVGRFEV